MRAKALIKKAAVNPESMLMARYRCVASWATPFKLMVRATNTSPVSAAEQCTYCRISRRPTAPPRRLVSAPAVVARLSITNADMPAPRARYQISTASPRPS